LLAEVPLPAEKSHFQPPRIYVQNVERLSATLRVFRQAEIQAEIEKTNGWTTTDAPVGSFEGGRGRLVAEMRGDSAELALPLISLALNRPRLSGQSLVHVRQMDDEWVWEADFDLQIDEGLLDELVVSIPSEFSANVEIFQTMDHGV